MNQETFPIRKATHGDANAAWDVRKEAILDQCTGFYTASQLNAWTLGPASDKWADLVKQSFYVATDKDNPVATGMITIDTRQVDAIFVRPSHMGLGIGRDMMCFLEGIARMYGLYEITLQSTLNSVSFYRSLGFQGETISQYHSPREISIACVPMIKKLGVAGTHNA